MILSRVCFANSLSKENIDQIIQRYLALIENVGDSILNMKGLKLLEALKRDAVCIGPYPDVTLFEAANRIMTDLVILYGTKWLLDHHTFPFNEYMVEYGNESKNQFDIRAQSRNGTLIGEAFNVAPSFFQGKKSAMLNKLRSSVADYKLIMFNHDAVSIEYEPKPASNEYFVRVNIRETYSKITPLP